MYFSSATLSRLGQHWWLEATWVWEGVSLDMGPRKGLLVNFGILKWFILVEFYMLILQYTYVLNSYRWWSWIRWRQISCGVRLTNVNANSTDTRCLAVPWFGFHHQSMTLVLS